MGNILEILWLLLQYFRLLFYFYFLFNLNQRTNAELLFNACVQNCSVSGETFLSPKDPISVYHFRGSNQIISARGTGAEEFAVSPFLSRRLSPQD